MVTDPPFKVNETTIVILNDLPVLQCSGCSEYLLENAVMERVDEILGRTNSQEEPDSGNRQIDTAAWEAFVSETYGSMVESPFERGLQGDFEVREPFR